MQRSQIGICVNNETIKLPGESYSKNIRARFWLTGKESVYLGIGRITLLEKIQELGSISAAAKDMGMSYKKAWKLIDELNKMFDEPLVIKEQGGRSGGGTRLTDKGLLAIKQFRSFEERLIKFLKSESDMLSF